MMHQIQSDRSRALRVATAVISTAFLLVGLCGWPSLAPAQQAGQKTFPTARAACEALVSALKSHDESALISILGKDAKDIVSSGNPAEDKQRQNEFVQKYQQMHRLVTEPDGKTTLYVGAENWPMPIPLLKKGNEWYFDTPAGKQEILYRRIGKNELAVTQVCRELVDAEKEYEAEPHDGQPRQYAQRIASEPGKHDGLYWPVSVGQPESPIGPLVAAAAVQSSPAQSGQNLEPFQGYYFRILTGQKNGKGSGNYVVDGKMTRGFAFVAYPAQYRVSGVMTFIVDQDGIVYEKDLGPKTDTVAKHLTEYDRNATWRQAD